MKTPSGDDWSTWERRLRAAERKKGAAIERARIAKAQAGALRNLRVLFAPECDSEEFIPAGCTGRRHKVECARGDFERQLRWLRDATREPKR